VRGSFPRSSALVLAHLVMAGSVLEIQCVRRSGG